MPRDFRPRKDPDADWNFDVAAAITEVQEIAERLEEKIDEAPEHVQDRASEFFSSVLEKAQDIAATVARTRRATSKQLEALQNMEAGVDRWLDHDS